MMKDDSYQRGLAMLEKVHGGHAGEEMVKALGEISPDYVDMVIRWSFGEIASREGLDLKSRLLVIIAACIALGADVQLRAYYETAFAGDIDKETIIEVILQMSIMVGMPAATNALLWLFSALMR